MRTRAIGAGARAVVSETGITASDRRMAPRAKRIAEEGAARFTSCCPAMIAVRLMTV